jgi:hypothetical protein
MARGRIGEGPPGGRAARRFDTSPTRLRRVETGLRAHADLDQQIQQIREQRCISAELVPRCGGFDRLELAMELLDFRSVSRRRRPITFTAARY